MARWDPLAAIAALIASVMVVVYLAIIDRQGGEPLSWFLGALVAAALLAIYGTVRAAPGRGPAMAVAGVLLTVLGVLGILSIGLPILVAGILALVAAVRSRNRRPGSDAVSG